MGKISDIFAGCDIDESFPTKSNVDGINRTIELLEAIDGGLVFVNLVETDMLWGTATTRRTSIAACRTSIGACPTSWRRCIRAIS